MYRYMHVSVYSYFFCGPFGLKYLSIVNRLVVISPRDTHNIGLPAETFSLLITT